MGGSVCKAWFKNEMVKVIILGLDAAGKTTMLYQLKLKELVTTIPTIGWNVEDVAHNGTTVTLWDLPSRDKMRVLWRFYFPATDGVIVVVDSSDKERQSELKEELKSFLMEDDLRDVDILFVANKQDIEGCLTLDEIKEQLELDKMLNRLGLERNWHMIPTVATTREGLEEGMDWLVEQISVRKAKTTVSHRIMHTVNTVRDSGLNSLKWIWNQFQPESGKHTALENSDKIVV